MTKTLSELKAESLAKCELADVFEVDEGLPKEAGEILSEYFGGFLPPGKKCVQCELDLAGFFGTFQWGLVHGEGHCSECGYPARGYHRPQDSEGEILFLSMPLQYHPDVLEERDDEA